MQLQVCGVVNESSTASCRQDDCCSKAGRAHTTAGQTPDQFPAPVPVLGMVLVMLQIPLNLSWLPAGSCSLTLGVVPVPDPCQRGRHHTADQAGALGGIVQPPHNMLHVQPSKKRVVEILWTAAEKSGNEYPASMQLLQARVEADTACSMAVPEQSRCTVVLMGLTTPKSTLAVPASNEATLELCRHACDCRTARQLCGGWVTPHRSCWEALTLSAATLSA